MRKLLKTFSGTYSEYKSFSNASAAPTIQVKVEKVKISEPGKSQRRADILEKAETAGSCGKADR